LVLNTESVYKALYSTSWGVLSVLIDLLNIFCVVNGGFLGPHPNCCAL